MARYQVDVYDDTSTLLTSCAIQAPEDGPALRYAEAKLTVHRAAARVAVSRPAGSMPFATFEKGNVR